MVLHVPSNKTQSWGWLEPNQPRILDIIFPDKTVYSIKPYKLKEYMPFKYIVSASYSWEHFELTTLLGRVRWN